VRASRRARARSSSESAPASRRCKAARPASCGSSPTASASRRSQAAGAQTLLVDAAHRAEHAQRQLLRAHLHREHRHRHAVVDGDMLADVQREAVLPSTAAATMTRSPAAARGHPVDIDEAGRHTGHVRRLARSNSSLMRSTTLVSSGSISTKPCRRARPPRRCGRPWTPPRRGSSWSRAPAVERGRGDLVADRDQAPQHRSVADDLAVAADVAADGVFCASAFR